jgi:4-hydroxythreonine-4-phosphate dehydrogenase
MTRPHAPVLISCGEPAGIGPEIAVGAWQALAGEVPMVWMGDPRHLPPGTPYEVVSAPEEVSKVNPDVFPVLRHRFHRPSVAGQPDPLNAEGVIEVIRASVALVSAGRAAALCTAPIHKKALIDGAGFSYPGHTEFLQALSGRPGRAVMMLASETLRVVPATIHIPLEEVPQALTPALLRETLEITDEALRRNFGIASPRIALAGLNPHAGEGGAMGRQEVDWISRLVSDLVAEGYDLRGPLPADTMFHARARESYDAAVAMYHDQALIPIKTLDFDRGVNVTLGLPFIRTSPDHGTAFDIAGKGVANPTSMIEAIRLAARMAKRHA